ncbi:hypothetical protein [Paraburkholderia caffeinilytica]|uniref:Uncharacterized protein n=1 Tax=Paraburkholderia caffeinilytica TaxID=1761016 RepID=A0ABQ1NIX2_9BURK|nr:hypothetical protein [Paraburkholderia caffeinilytica]GGC66945.1 hypothetical protein GCM10011400_63600 [Paraburkholderia caffeinilytica]CAB3803489.1 hypothetical protein LMG28690_05800 [Paraburkholderia caffeinilytica]
MLMTDATWAQRDAFKQQLATPYQAWDSVGWTDEPLNFLVIASHKRRVDASLPAGWLLAGSEVLLEAVSKCERDSFLVYVLDRATDGIGLHLYQVAGIWRERKPNAGDEPWRWYSTSHGELKPCTRIRRDLAFPPELVSERSFDTTVVATSRDA